MPNMYTFTFEAQHINIITSALTKLPYEVAQPMIEAFRKSCREQDEARAKAAAEQQPGPAEPKGPQAKARRTKRASANGHAEPALAQPDQDAAMREQQNMGR